MIYMVTAIYAEACAIIAHFHLKKDVTRARFQVFGNQEAGICLIITGTGAIPAAVAVAEICGRAGREDFLVNVGICAGIQGKNVSGKESGCPIEGMAGDIFLCNKIREQATGRTFYPDILYRHGFKEAQILTGAVPYERTGTEDGFFLYDMEAAAVYQAGLYYFGPHQMSFLKVVSDQGDGRDVTPEQVRNLMEKNLESIVGYITCLQGIGGMAETHRGLPEDAASGEMELLGRDMCCSQAMAVSLRQYVRYGVLSGVDFTALREEMYREGKLPCRDKKEGKLCFEAFKERVL